MVPGPRAMSNKKADTGGARRQPTGGESTRASSNRIALDRRSVPPLNLSGSAPCDHPSARVRAMLVEISLAGDIVDRRIEGLIFSAAENARHPRCGEKRNKASHRGIWILAAPTLGPALALPIVRSNRRRCPLSHRPSTSAAVSNRAKGATFGQHCGRARIFVPRCAS